MARVSSPARRHRPRLSRLNAIVGPRLRRGHEADVDLRTARLVLTPVGGADLPDLRAIKADPRVFAIMLGGVRTPGRRPRSWPTTWSPGAPTVSASGRSASWRGRFVGITGLERSAGRPRRRAALRAMARGAGTRAGARGGRRRAALRSRAGGAAAHRRGGAGEQLRLAHGAWRIGMTGVQFIQHGWRMVMYERVRCPDPPPRT